MSRPHFVQYMSPFALAARYSVQVWQKIFRSALIILDMAHLLRWRNICMIAPIALLCLPAFAAAPVVEDTATSTTTNNSTSHSVTMPTGVESGDLLLVFCGLDGTPTLSATGWTSLVSQAHSGTSDIFHGFYRESDGTEGSAVTFTSSASEKGGCVAYRISGAEDPGTQAPEISTAALGSSTSPDPSSVTPAGGADDYLYIAVTSANRRSFTGFPATYLGTGSAESGSLGTDAGVGFGHLGTTGSTSEDPGAFTIDSTDTWAAFTVAVTPASGGGSTLTIPQAAYHLRQLGQ